MNLGKFSIIDNPHSGWLSDKTFDVKLPCSEVNPVKSKIAEWINENTSSAYVAAYQTNEFVEDEEEIARREEEKKKQASPGSLQYTIHDLHDRILRLREERTDIEQNLIPKTNFFSPKRVDLKKRIVEIYEEIQHLDLECEIAKSTLQMTPFQVSRAIPQKMIEMYIFCFLNEDDALLFKLTWGGEN